MAHISPTRPSSIGSDWLECCVRSRMTRALVMTSWSGGHIDLTNAVTKADAIFRYVFGSADREGVGLTDSAHGWSVLYRVIKQVGLRRRVHRRTVDVITHISSGDFVLRRWDGNIYRQCPAAPDKA